MNAKLVIFCLALTAVGPAARAETSEAQASEKASTTTTSTAGFSDYRVRLDEQESRFSVGIYGQASQFTFDGRSLLGNALELDVTCAFAKNFAASVSISQALSLEGGFGVLYTGIRGAAQYAFWGDFIRRDSAVMVNGQRSLSARGGQSTLLAGEFGIEQYMFNGTARVVPATGGSVGVRFDKNFGRFRASLIARYGMLLVASEMSSMMLGGAGLIYAF